MGPLEKNGAYAVRKVPVSLRMDTRLLTVAVFLASLCTFCYGGEAQEYKRTLETYDLPDVTLVNQDGAKVRLTALLNCGKPVLVDFIFTTCTTICPLLSMGFSNFSDKLGAEAERVQLVSISVDPEHDTPPRMKAYLRRYKARRGWDFLTGSRGDIDRVLKAFKAYSANKMNHLPLILIKSPSDSRWVRIYGLIGTRELLREYQMVLP